MPFAFIVASASGLLSNAMTSQDLIDGAGPRDAEK
jgi:hypothetical protein